MAISHEAWEEPTPSSPPAAAPHPASARPPPQTQRKRAIPETCQEWEEETNPEDHPTDDVTIRQPPSCSSITTPEPSPQTTTEPSPPPITKPSPKTHHEAYPTAHPRALPTPRSTTGGSPTNSKREADRGYHTARPGNPEPTKEEKEAQPGVISRSKGRRDGASSCYRPGQLNHRPG